MRLAALSVCLAMLATAANAADDCSIYIDASVTGNSTFHIKMADYLHFTWFVPGGETFDCVGKDDHQPHGPYETKCVARSTKKTSLTSVDYFKGPRKGSQPTMLFEGDVWYSKCDTDLKPFVFSQ